MPGRKKLSLGGDSPPGAAVEKSLHIYLKRLFEKNKQIGKFQKFIFSQNFQKSLFLYNFCKIFLIFRQILLLIYFIIILD